MASGSCRVWSSSSAVHVDCSVRVPELRLNCRPCNLVWAGEQQRLAASITRRDCARILRMSRSESPGVPVLGYLRATSSNPRVRPACWPPSKSEPGQMIDHHKLTTYSICSTTFCQSTCGHFPWLQCIHLPLADVLRQALIVTAFRSAFDRFATRSPSAAYYAEEIPH